MKNNTQKTDFVTGFCTFCGGYDILLNCIFSNNDVGTTLNLCEDCIKFLKLDSGEEMDKLLETMEKIRKREKIDQTDEYKISHEIYGGGNSEESLKEDLMALSEKDVIENIKAKIKKPSELIKALDEYVIGQEAAKKQLAIEVYSHFVRLTDNSCSMVEKNNIVLTGPTGVGKTYLIKTLAKILDIPLVIAPANMFSSTGYAGKDVSDILKNLYQQTYNKYYTERGIIYIDEIDKIRATGSSNDVGGAKVQQELLSFTEGRVEEVKLNEYESVEIDTSNILFICGGAFEGIEEIVKKRLKVNDKKIGFNIDTNTDKEKEKNVDYYRSQIIQEDLIKYGLIAEFVGRFPVMTNLINLNKDELGKILKNKHGLIAQNKALLKHEGKTLTFSEDAINAISDKAIKTKTGARALKGMIKNIMNPVLYDATNPENKKKRFVVSKDFVEQIIK